MSIEAVAKKNKISYATLVKWIETNMKDTVPDTDSLAEEFNKFVREVNPSKFSGQPKNTVSVESIGGIPPSAPGQRYRPDLSQDARRQVEPRHPAVAAVLSPQGVLAPQAVPVPEGTFWRPWEKTLFPDVG
ncbi:hypothetical protein ABK905_05995 [Acerihabitans sp. KWT182]|uniref:Uncharacterized protein n=1 Tax=Acerihabitans sp. KWT182 TaxID=3157919 RepID=A0AAU7QC08_9GAMM